MRGFPGSSNGRTHGSGPWYRGSNPCPGTRWRYRLGVRTDGSQPSDRGSNPRSATTSSPHFHLAARAFVIRRLAVVCVLAIAAGCGAPSAERATGDVARAVEAALAGGVRRSFRDSTSGVVASHGRCGSPEPRPHSCGAPTCRGPEARSLPPREGLGATSGSARASRPRGRPMSVLTRGFDRWSSSPRRCAPSWALRPWVSSPGRLHRLFSISTPYEGTSPYNPIKAAKASAH